MTSHFEVVSLMGQVQSEIEIIGVVCLYFQVPNFEALHA
jgi:hypothetical protein